MARKLAESKKILEKFNGWGGTIIETFIPRIRYFSQALSERILPAFEDIEEAAERSYKQYAYEQASDDTEYEWNDSEYGYMRDVRQSVIKSR